MKPIYMTHELHGVHVAYAEDEIELNKAVGWVVYGEDPPGAKRDEVREVVAKKRGRPRKVS